MAKFRQQHQRNRKSHSLFSMRTIGTVILFTGLIVGYLSKGGFDLTNIFDFDRSAQTTEDDYFDAREKGAEGPGMLLVQEEFLPVGGKGAIIRHKHYALSYSEEHEQAEWVAYELTKESIQVPNVERTGDFRRDNQVKTKSADREDYRGSGYDRGHMVPAGDMAFSRSAMSETFFMSNMSPQVRAFNGGIWRELEENTRDWAYKSGHVYIVTGPILKKHVNTTIGRNEVTVPEAYYKVILDNRDPERKGIAFIIPNEVTDKHLRTFALTIDQAEKATGIDFFANLLSKEEAKSLEGKMDISRWKFNKGKYRSRIKNWNNR